MKPNTKQNNNAESGGTNPGRKERDVPRLRLLPRIVEVEPQLDGPNAENIRGHVAAFAQDISEDIHHWYSCHRRPGVCFPWGDPRRPDMMSRKAAAEFLGVPVEVLKAPKGCERLAFQFPGRDHEVFLMTWKLPMNGEE